jgi:three-Cys-motif partner protein
MSMASSSIEQGHTFGGVWTELKLSAVSYYFGFFTKVLKEQSFKLWYIDAFAGSGSRVEQVVTGGLFDGRPAEVEQQELAGSVLKALDIDPPFERLVFIEGHLGRFRELNAIRTANSDRNIECRHGEANEQLRQIFKSPPWSGQRGSKGKLRAVVFLDPYGMNVEWKTLELLAETQSVDVWYLFPINAVTRQLAIDLNKVDAHKQRSLDGIFGTTEWRSELYAPSLNGDLFDMLATRADRDVGVPEIERYARKRLGTIFRYVSEPLPLLANSRGHLFSLFCLSNSDSDRAIGLIKKGVAGVMKNYGPASHRRSDP